MGLRRVFSFCFHRYGILGSATMRRMIAGPDCESTHCSRKRLRMVRHSEEGPHQMSDSGPHREPLLGLKYNWLGAFKTNWDGNDIANCVDASWIAREGNCDLSSTTAHWAVSEAEQILERTTIYKYIKEMMKKYIQRLSTVTRPLAASVESRRLLWDDQHRFTGIEQ